MKKTKSIKNVKRGDYIMDNRTGDLGIVTKSSTTIIHEHDYIKIRWLYLDSYPYGIIRNYKQKYFLHSLPYWLKSININK